MSRKMLKVLILGAMVVSALASASSASAVTWTSNGSAAGTAFTATAPAAKLQVNSSPVVGILCNTTSATGKAYGPGPNALTVKAADVSLAFSNCTAGGLPATVSCTANGVGLYLTGATVGTSTPGQAKQNGASLCTITVTSLPGCTITVASNAGAGGALANGSYNNTGSTLTIFSTGQTLTASWTSACTIFATRPGSASATFGSNATPPGNLIYTVTSAYKPTFNAS